VRLLVIKPSALGDVAHALQVVPHLKEVGWCQDLGWVIDEAYAPLVSCCSQVTEIIPYPRMRWRRHWPVSEMWQWAKSLRERRYDAVLDLQGLARSGLMTLASGVPRRIGLASAREGARLVYNERVEDRAEHAVDRYASACGQLTGRCPTPTIFLEAPEASGLPVECRPGAYTVIHVYSMREEKCWPWRRVGPLILELGSECCVLVGQGPAFPCVEAPFIDLRNRTSMKELITILAHARTVISVDSGPLHVAASFGVPVIGIFGASLPARTRPRGSKVTCLVSNRVDHAGKQSILRPAEAARAMEDLSVSQVAQAWWNLNACGNFTA